MNDLQLNQLFTYHLIIEEGEDEKDISNMLYQIQLLELFDLKDLDVTFLFDLGKIFKKYKFTFTQEFHEIIMSCCMVNNLAKELCSDFNKTQKEVINELTQINKIIEI